LEQDLVKNTCDADYRLRVAAVARVRAPAGGVTSNPQDCDDHWTASAVSGVFKINPLGTGEFEVYCDFDSIGGPWTVFQNRFDGSIEFYLGYSAYQSGFGLKAGEFWLGLDKIHRLSQLGDSQLKIDLCNGAGTTEDCRSALYGNFAVGDAASKYLLTAADYVGLGATSGVTIPSSTSWTGFTVRPSTHTAYCRCSTPDANEGISICHTGCGDPNQGKSLSLSLSPHLFVVPSFFSNSFFLMSNSFFF
jgi:hypothetical protein